MPSSLFIGIRRGQRMHGVNASQSGGCGTSDLIDRSNAIRLLSRTLLHRNRNDSSEASLEGVFLEVTKG